MSKSYLDSDLAHLRAELRKAYIAKALESQIKEHEAEMEIEKIRENYASRLQKMKCLEAKNEAKAREFESSRNREMYRKELEEQIDEKERARQADEVEAKKERRLLEEADRFVDEEDRRMKLETKRRLAERLQREKRIFEEIRAIRKRMALEVDVEERKKIVEYNDEVAKRAEELERLRQEQKIRRENLITNVANMLINVESKRLERESKLGDLVAEEIAWELVIQEREDELRRKNMRQQLAEDLREQMTFTQECARLSLERDRVFAETVMKRIMEDEKIEKLTNEAKLRNRMSYRDDLLKLMEERKRMRRLEEERIRTELRKEIELEEIKRNETREARAKLLTEHAPYVAHYVRDNLLTAEEQKIVTKAGEKMK